LQKNGSPDTSAEERWALVYFKSAEIHFSKFWYFLKRIHLALTAHFYLLRGWEKLSPAWVGKGMLILGGKVR